VYIILGSKTARDRIGHLRFTRESNTTLGLEDTFTNTKAGFLFIGSFPHNRDVFDGEKLFSSNVTHKKRHKTKQGQVKIMKHFP
jgi:hypothetical protein